MASALAQEVKAGTVNDELVSSVDIAPTFLELAGIHPAKFLAGTSFLPLLKIKPNDSSLHLCREELA